MTLAALVLELNLLIALLGATLALLRSGSVPGRLSYVGLALAGAGWCAGELLVERGALETWAGLRLALLGLVMVGPFWVAVAAHLARLSVARRLPWIALPLALPGLLVWSLLFVEPWDATVMPAPHRPGTLWWAYSAYAYALVVLGTGIHVWHGVRDRSHRAQMLGIGLCGLLPLAVHAAWALRGFPGALDPTPMALTPVGIALASALFPGGLLDRRPAVHSELIDHLPLGVLIADRSGTVFRVNPVAERALGMVQAEGVGRALDALLAEAPPHYRVEIAQVTSAGRVVARFALLHPPPRPSGADRRAA